jgi:hypothetical protein
MKKIFAPLVALMMALAITSCQNDDATASQELSKNSPLTTLLMRVTHHAGTAGRSSDDDDEDDDDDICFAVSLPVTIQANGQSVTISTEAQYAAVLAVLDQYDEDDTITAGFVFPISIVFADGTTQQITDAAQLETAMDNCSDDDDNGEDIECLDIAYPISITYTDAATGATLLTFNNDNELYTFLLGLDTDDVLAISYPLTITDATGATLTVNNNDELEDAIEDADLACNGDSDDDSDDSDSDGNNGDDD